MKIAFVANTCWNIYNFRKGLVQHFLDKGDEVLVLTPKDEYTARVIEWGVAFLEIPFDGTGNNPLNDLKTLRKIYSVFKTESPEIAFGYTIKANIYSCLAGALSRIPVICNVSGLGTVFLTEGMAGKIAMALYRISFKYASYIFFQNIDDKELFTSRISTDEKKTEVIPGSGIALDSFKYSKPSISGKTVFLMISRLIVEKGVREYAEAAAHFKDDPNVSFVLVGKLDETHARSISKSELDKWIDEKWLEYQPHSDNIKELITESEVVVLPSYREGTPRTLLEGAAIGRPLLTSDVPGCREVVQDGYNGFLFEVKNPKSIVDKVKLYMALSKEERVKLSENSRKLVEEKYDEKHIINAYDEQVRRITVSR